MENVIEPVRIKENRPALRDLFERATQFEPLSYIECGARSWILDSRPEYRAIWDEVLSLHGKVHPDFCPLATGFNYNPTSEHGVPPHVDLDEAGAFNLLLPVEGTAKIALYETRSEELEFRHGKTHWQMLRPGVRGEKIGEYLIDQPTLLNTAILHEVVPIHTPRLVWCTRWIGLDRDLSFSAFKKRVEEVLGA